jgi:hypothetical protein
VVEEIHSLYESWDDDHCEFCWDKFMEEDYRDVLHEGYATEGNGIAAEAQR